MEIVPLKKWHLEVINMQGMQEHISRWVTPEVKAALEQGNSFTAMDGDEVLACGGIIEMWGCRGQVWAMISDHVGPKRFLAMHRAVERFFEICSIERIEAVTDVNFGPGCRWLEKLGFRIETPLMKGYLPGGRDATMYVRGV